MSFWPSMTDDLDELPHFGPPRPPVLARVIDYETTGTPEDEGAQICEMARIDIELSSLELFNPFARLVAINGDMPAQAQAVHHISNADLATAEPRGFLWAEFWRNCGPEDLCAAHNAKFEMHFHAGNGRAWICTFKCARILWPDAPKHDVQTLRYWLKLDDQIGFDPVQAYPPHRAAPDAYVTALILRRMLAVKPWHELVMYSTYPVLSHKFSFGKHKGAHFADVPRDYLEWIRDKSEMDEDTKFSAGYWLKRRK